MKKFNFDTILEVGILILLFLVILILLVFLISFIYYLIVGVFNMKHIYHNENYQAERETLEQLLKEVI